MDALDLDDLIPVARLGDNLFLLVYKDDIENPDCYAIKVDFLERECYVGKLDDFLKFTPYDAVVDELTRKNIRDRVKKSIPDKVFLKATTDFMKLIE
jgi:hypothetical protein